jgi:hypothetical protein
MIKGCKKKIIQIKDTGSKFFEEAYFVIRDEALKAEINECNIIRDATAIVNEYISGATATKTRRSRAKSLILFLLGFFIGAILSALSLLIFF